MTSVPNIGPTSPIWIPGKGEVPLSPERAFSIANKEFQNGFSKFDAFDLKDIQLERFHSKQNIWIYRISYVQRSEDGAWIQVDEHNKYKENLIIVYTVFLDGSVCSPKPK